MGLIGRAISSVRGTFRGAAARVVKFDVGGGDIRTGVQYQPPGEDSASLPGDFVYCASSPRTGALQVLGAVDPLEQPAGPAGAVGPGGKRIYSRDENGAIQAQVTLLSDGTVDISNASGVRVTVSTVGAITLTSAGGQEININGATINDSGEITAAKVSALSIVVDGKELADHTHNFTNADGVPSVTEGNN